MKPVNVPIDSMKAQYALVKSYYGLGGDLCVFLGALRFARQTNRDIVVDWSGGFYGRVQSGNLFNEYFEAPQVLTTELVADRPVTVFPSQWQDRLLLPPLTYVTGADLTLSRPEEVPKGCDAECVVITRDSRLMHRNPEDFYATAQSLRPVEEIRSAVSEMMHKMGSTRTSIGIHFRHGNGERKVIPPDPRWFRNRINARARALNLDPNDISLFVATDCSSVVDYFRRYYPNTFDLEKEYRPVGEGALHVGRDDLSDTDRMELAKEALVDMYTLSQCDYFVGSKGFFSLFVKLIRGKNHTILYEGSRLFNNYNFTESFYPVERDPLFAKALQRTRQPSDGLFVSLSEEKRELHYFDEQIYSVDRTVAHFDAEELQALRGAIWSRRTY